MLVEFGISTLLYERASQFSVRDDEARRLAEHLVICERLITERGPAERPAMAVELTTDRYRVLWRPQEPRTPAIAPSLDGMRRQVVAWEPGLGDNRMRLWLASPGRRSAVSGVMQLPDRYLALFPNTAPAGRAQSGGRADPARANPGIGADAARRPADAAGAEAVAHTRASPPTGSGTGLRRRCPNRGRLKSSP